MQDCPEEWHRGMSAGLLDPMVPMDTIFVKHVRENGPAAKAGLATGMLLPDFCRRLTFYSEMSLTFQKC